MDAAHNKRKRDEESPLVRQDATEAPTKSTLSKSEEISFPRGGSSALSPLEVKQVANEVVADVLFGKDDSTAVAEGPKTKKKKKTKKSADGTASDDEEEKEDKTDLVEHFGMKQMTKGTIVLGQIHTINKHDLKIVLVDGLHGYVSLTDISEQMTSALEKLDEEMESADEKDENSEYESSDDESAVAAPKELPDLNKYFKVGQWLRCVVQNNTALESKKNKKLELSIEPSAVNVLEDDDFAKHCSVQCSVKSIEDHGAVLDLGLDNLTGFISKKDLPAFESLLPGMVFLATVSKRSGRTVNVNLDLASKSTKVEKISSIDAILPGQSIDFLTQTVTNHGVIGKAFGLITAFLPLPHSNRFTVEELKHAYSIGNLVNARILATTTLKNGDKVAVVSTQPHILSLSPKLQETEALESFSVGYTFDSCTVKGRDSQFFYVSINNEQVGQIHLSKAGETEPTGTVKARVLGYNNVDNLYTLTSDPTSINFKYLHSSDIPAGEVLSACEIVTVSEKGIELKIFNGQFKAFVPPFHISDTRLVYPERKFKIGSKVKGRALSVDALGRVTVTLKKSFVNVDEESMTLVTKKEDVLSVEEGELKTVGTVEIFKPNGCVISFFNNIKAFIPNKEISEAFVKKAQEHLRLGQTVLVKILNHDFERNRIIASCKISAESSSKQKTAIESLIVGKSIIDAIVIEKTKDSVIVESKDSGLRGVIYTGHLSDDRIEQNRAAQKKLKIHSEVRGLILDKDTRTHVFNMSCKKSLIKDAENNTLPLSYSDIKLKEKSEPLHGYVKSVSDRGVFVAFNGKFVGLVLPSYAAETRDIDIHKKYYVNQSVTVYLLRTDEEHERFLLTVFKPKADTKKNNSAVSNPVDKSIKDLSEFTIGKVTQASVTSVKRNQLNVTLADNLHGRISISEVFDKFEDIRQQKAPLSVYKKNDIISVKVIGFHDIKSRKFLPISHTTSKSHLIELTAKPSSLTAPVSEKKLQDFSAEQSVFGFINNYSNDTAWLTITPTVKAKLPIFEISDEGNDFFLPIEEKYPIGTALKVTVKSIDSEHDSLVVTGRSHTISSISEIKEGDVLPARVISVQDTYVLLSLGKDVTGVSFITDALDDYSRSLKDVYDPKKKSIVSATVLNVDVENKKINLSLRSSSPKDRTLISSSDLKRGDVVRGFVKSITDKGIFVSLSSVLQAFVPVSKLTDAFIKDWKKFFKRGQNVIGKVVNCESDSRVLLTLKESEVNGELNVLKSYSDIKVGDIFQGSVKNLTEFGVFVKLDGTVNVTGLAHKTEVADAKLDDLQNLFGEGDKVKAIVLKTNPEKKQISLGLKASYFTNGGSDAQEDEDEEEEEDVEEEEENVDELHSGVDVEQKDNGILSKQEDDDDEIMDDAEFIDSDAEIDENAEGRKYAPASANGLSLSTGFDWTASILDQAQDEENSSDEDEDFTKSKKQMKRKAHLVQDKTIDINTRIPESVGDFERLIMGNPNSSVVWMNYMAFHLQLSEVEKAREIVDRALKTINFREEAEKLNIWIASLNLENTFGTEETLEDVFTKACQYMDSFVMHMKLLSIYQMSGKLEKAKDLFRTTAKKFGSEKVSVWVTWGEFLIDNKLIDEAHEVLGKALKALPKRDHIEVVRKFAQLEFGKGDPEQGRSLFEGLLADAPKRVDLWNVYIDQEMKHGEKTKVEDLFERVLTKKITRKQAKFFFNKWLQFEEQKDDQKLVQYVKSKAAEYVKKNKSADDD
ncbi:unnamed protein product [Kluyveromyces dobzhanskii CBS 2104]|uniref:rRNA biogenesis protein RRP5 n=1 Tax=Kluyveromyces dobzhanskii CBS 2104 TaxID=1427455 RepID=A0A0A8L067_9SACH|nr:unnamed protein product [Kluyveromyces dobzhanskii CBS 2104]